MFVPGKTLQPSLMFEGKVRAYPSDTFQLLHYRVGSWPHPQTLDEAERLTKDKLSSLVQKSVNYVRKKFHSTFLREPLLRWKA